MSSDYVIAKRYAKALFSLTEDANIHQQRLDTLNRLVSLFSNPELSSVLQNPIITKKDKKELFDTVLKELSSSDTELKNFLFLLVDERREVFIPNIVNLFSRYLDEKLNICRVSITQVEAASELDPMIKNLLEIIEKKKNKTLKIQQQVDPNILGGAVVEFEDFRLDISVKSELNKIISHAAR